jgi:hypothetical protein
MCLDHRGFALIPAVLDEETCKELAGYYSFWLIIDPSKAWCQHRSIRTA